MSTLLGDLPVRRSDLVIRPLDENGRYVVKDPCSGSYFRLGEQEHFLLLMLDGQRCADAVCRAFEERFAESLSEGELDDFIALARKQQLLQETHEEASESTPADKQIRREGAGRPYSPRQSLLYWRKSIFDPDRFFNVLEPRIRFFWTRGFMIFSAACILWATALVWLNSHDLADSFRGALHWETVVMVWLTILLVTMLHEFAHGLTCKHYGGEVHEIGFLLLFFMPCFYCNVSDAWLFKEKSKRLWVTWAGGYFELFVWALAVFVWRISLADSLINYLAFVVLMLCGVQTLFNFNPLIKLDGYYLLSDWLELPNLQARAVGYFKAHLRRLLWGARRPRPEQRGRLLLSYGLVSWIYSLVFVSLMLWGMFWLFQNKWGVIGMGAVAMLALVTSRGLFRDASAGEARRMLAQRHRRLLGWLLALGGIALALCFVEIEDRVGGPFRLRPAEKREIRAPVTGFVKEVYCDEGDRVSLGALVVRLEMPELASRIAQKQAESREVQANLKLLEQGPRPEEVLEQRRRLERARTWRDLAKNDLAHAQQALQAELARLDKQIAQYDVERDTAQDAWERSKSLRTKATVTQEQYREAERRFLVAQTQLAQAQFQKRHREALGTREAIAGLDAEAELARREKDLADTQGTLTLLEAGTRPEEIDAARAHLARLNEEARYLEALGSKLLVGSPVPGLITTAHLKEKVGQYLREGDLICLVEEPATLEAEIALAEQDVARVRSSQLVELKARALPFETFRAKVERIAPSATPGDVQGTVTVYCRLENPSIDLRPAMSGYARISTGERASGAVVLDRVLRFLRTEFWW